MNLVNILKRTDIFYDLGDEQLELVAEVCHEVRFRMRDMIFQEQSASDELYVIAKGEVEILVDPNIIDAGSTGAQPVTIATMRAGQAFGEFALVDQGLRSAGARSASDDTRLLVVPRAKLLNLCEQDPELGYRVMRNLAAELALKMRSANFAIREQLVWGNRRRE
jgi:CRP/FNR family cyclic AMP-dependent transcriptional regulator